MKNLKVAYYISLGVTVVLGMSLICFVSLEQWLRFENYNGLVPIAIGWFSCLTIIGLSLVAWMQRVHKLRNIRTWHWKIVLEALAGEVQLLAKVAEARKKYK